MFRLTTAARRGKTRNQDHGEQDPDIEPECSRLSEREGGVVPSGGGRTAKEKQDEGGEPTATAVEWCVVVQCANNDLNKI